MKTKIRYLLRKSALTGALLVAVLLSYGCTIYPNQPVGTEIDVNSAPPAPMVEVTPLSPGPGYVWIGGEWDWRDGWVWDQGHYARPPHSGAVWIPNRYEVRDGNKVFIRGGWK